MSYTKRQFIMAALEELGIVQFDTDIDPAQVESAVRRLDSMMASWNADGIRTAYPLPGSPESSDIDAETNVNDWVNEPIITNLAVKLAPSYGKQAAPDTRLAAKSGYESLSRLSSQPREQLLPSSMPRGAGHKPNRDGSNNNYFQNPTPNLPTGQGDLLDIPGQTL